MNEDRPSNIARIWEQRAEPFGIYTGCKRSASCLAVDIIKYGGIVLALVQTGCELATNSFVAKIDMMGVDQRGVLGAFCPYTSDRFRQNAQHAADSLKIGQSRRLAGQRIE